MTRTAGETDPLLLDGDLTPQEREVRARVRKFGETIALPLVNAHWERAEFPAQLVPALAALGVAGGTIAGYGCPGLSATAAGLVTCELARIDGSVQTIFGGHSSLAMTTIALLGSEQQKQRWLPAMARMERLGAFAVTEPEHGSDAVAMETRAHREGASWVLRGRKRWIGLGTVAQLPIVWARDDEGEIGAFVVELPAAGWSATPMTGKAALRAIPNAEIVLDGVRIPLENRLAHANTFRDATRVLTRTRYNASWAALGHALASYEIALDHVRTRRQFGKPLAAFQLVQHRLATMLAEIAAMQLLCLRLSQLVERDEITAAMGSLAKMHNAAKARKVVADARDLLGGDGILLERHVVRHQSDMEAISTYEGTDFIQGLIVGRELTGISAFT
ncbi:MAG TPA: acyl-CoA dehydrogenase family protein [Candidatus Limnocylindria bacterium]|nr:acyl-CoA dehydrogenase family protein [Candidatus Limnocylindria bacterium]